MLISIEGADVSYHFVCFDKKGKEVEQSTGLASKAILEAVSNKAKPITDVFFVSHGWKGDRPAALEQCDAWIGQMAAMQSDRAHVRTLDPTFNPLIIGLHWPSQAWGEESEDGAESGLLSGGDPDGQKVDEVVDSYVQALGLEPAMRSDVATIVRAAPEGSRSLKLDPDVRLAYEKVAGAAELWSDEGDDTQEAWDAQKTYNNAAKPDADAGLLGGSTVDFFLTPLRQLSFWTMKARARKVGESGVATLLRDIQAASDRARIHLMGHSFGCIVVSAAVAGKSGKPLLRPVSSMMLVQGALSLWAYSKTPGDEDGYFCNIVRNKMVAGPIITTWSIYDKAVGNLYPIAARVARQDTLDLPKYGGTGAFGLQGPPDFAHELSIESSDHSYTFEAGKIYNVKSEKVIAKRDGLSGAHSDIRHPEVAHLAWAGIAAGMRA